MSSSYVGAFRAMTAAFIAAETQILGTSRKWHAVNSEQERLLNEIFPTTYAEAKKITEAETIVDWSEVPINDFLASRGIDIQLDQLGPDTFGFAAFMKVEVKWANPGEWCTVKIGRTHYDGARLDASNGSVVFSTSKKHDQPIATIQTTSNDVVHITKFNKDMCSFDLVALAQEIIKTREVLSETYGGVVFPATIIDVKPDVSWLLDMWTTTDDGRKATLAQALQQCKLRMDHLGAVFEDSFAGACCLTACMDADPDLVIDGSFLFVLERRGLALPVFVAVVRDDAWTDSEKSR